MGGTCFVPMFLAKSFFDIDLGNISTLWWVEHVFPQWYVLALQTGDISMDVLSGGWNISGHLRYGTVLRSLEIS